MSPAASPSMAMSEKGQFAYQLPSSTASSTTLISGADVGDRDTYEPKEVHLEPSSLRDRMSLEDSPFVGEGGPPGPGAAAREQLVVGALWILSFSSGIGLVLYNKYILSILGFGYPCFLTTCHMGFAVIGTRAAKWLFPSHVGHGPDNRLSWRIYARSIVPIGFLFSASLVLSNAAVLRLSVALVQMTKAFIPTSILLLSAALGLRCLDRTSLGAIGVISAGCALAALGEVQFNLIGFACQILAVLSESLRVVLIQLLLQGHKMDPLTSLGHYAPICFMLNSILVPLIEGPGPILALFPNLSPSHEPIPSSANALPSHLTPGSIHPIHLLANASLAFALNCFSLALMRRVGSLAMSIGGTIKDIALIGASVAVFGGTVTGSQLNGYGISVVGLVLYRYTA